MRRRAGCLLRPAVRLLSAKPSLQTETLALPAVHDRSWTWEPPAWAPSRTPREGLTPFLALPFGVGALPITGSAWQPDHAAKESGAKADCRSWEAGSATRSQEPSGEEHRLRQGPAGPGEATAVTPPQPAATWVDRAPPSLQPYLHLIRIDKPIGTWLLAWPCFWSIALAAPPGAAPDLRMLALFGTGAVLLRGAGCTINDLWDRDLDGQVARTRRRPLAAGLLTPRQAVAFLGLQLSAGLAILLQLNTYSRVLGASSLSLVVVYPLMKRVFGWPQLVLGMAFNWGALLGWAAIHGACDWSVVLPLYGAGILWTLVYDTIYAHQDQEDDAKIGIRSTALTLGRHSRAAMWSFAAGTVGLLGFTGFQAGCGVPYFLGVASAGVHLAWQLGTVNLDDRADCGAKFDSNKWVGAAVFAGTVADRVLG
ncbi:COQ2 [Auxenochlorella protothecoides x Auxenochlorella symbiontica]